MKATGKAKVARTDRTGLVFGIGHIHRLLREGNYAERVGSGASVFMAGVLEYLVTEIMTQAGATARLKNSKHIGVHHLPGLQDPKIYLKLRSEEATLNGTSNTDSGS